MEIPLYEADLLIKDLYRSMFEAGIVSSCLAVTLIIKRCSWIVLALPDKHLTRDVVFPAKTIAASPTLANRLTQPAGGKQIRAASFFSCSHFLHVTRNCETTAQMIIWLGCQVMAAYTVQQNHSLQMRYHFTKYSAGRLLHRTMPLTLMSQLPKFGRPGIWTRNMCDIQQDLRQLQEECRKQKEKLAIPGGFCTPSRRQNS